MKGYDLLRVFSLVVVVSIQHSRHCAKELLKKNSHESFFCSGRCLIGEKRRKIWTYQVAFSFSHVPKILSLQGETCGIFNKHKIPIMVKALQNKLSHRSWQFVWPKWVFSTYCMIACLLGRQGCADSLTLSLFLCLSVCLFSFLSQATGLCHKLYGWVTFCFVLCFLNVLWGLFDVDSLFFFFFVLMVCRAYLLVMSWGSWVAGEHLLLQQEVRAGSYWPKTLHRKRHLAFCTLLFLGWTAVLLLSKTKLPLWGMEVFALRVPAPVTRPEYAVLKIW